MRICCTFIRFFLCLVIPLFLFPIVVQAATKKTAVVARVIDGDSLELVQGNRSFQARLWGIDSPEYTQDFSGVAKLHLQRMVEKQTITIHRKYTDRYNRAVVMAWVNGMLINEVLVREGLAWVHVRYCNEQICESWQEHEKLAKKKRVGLWRDDDPIPPWRWKSRQGRENLRLD